MDKKVLKALKGSIKKWHNICYHNGEDLSAENCPLCQFFVDEHKWTDCELGCPVYLEAKDTSCQGTPYSRWSELCAREGYDFTSKTTWRASTPEKLKAAEKELKFLVCLLPEGEEAEMKDGWIWYWEWQ
jgi:uncharacterized protein with NAD-binding domain and iron-sulfur cluster